MIMSIKNSMYSTLHSPVSSIDDPPSSAQISVTPQAGSPSAPLEELEQAAPAPPAPIYYPVVQLAKMLLSQSQPGLAHPEDPLVFVEWLLDFMTGGSMQSTVPGSSAAGVPTPAEIPIFDNPRLLRL